MREELDAMDLDASGEAEARRLLAAAFETVPARPGLVAGLAAAANPHGPGMPASDVVGLVRHRATRDRRRRFLVPAGAVALAAAVAGGVTAGALTDGGQASPSALRALTAAVVETSAQSFSFANTSSMVNPTTTDPGPHLSYLTGKFNPVSGTGEEQSSVDFAKGAVTTSYLFVDGYWYMDVPGLTHGKEWVRERFKSEFPANGRDAALLIASPQDGGEPLNPADLLALLKTVTTVRAAGPASGPGWTGTRYSFTVPPIQRTGARLLISGTVSVDSSGRVRTLVTVSQIVESSGALWRRTTDTMTFGGFGIPVSVTPPPASEVYTRG